MKKLLGNKKGFTLIEMIVTIAIMTIIVSISVPSVTYAVGRRQRQAADADTQQMYRTAVSTISDLSREYKTPQYPNRVGADKGTEDTGSGKWYAGYADVLVRRLYANILGLDIRLMYWNGTTLVQPDGTTYLQRTNTVTAGNKNPYIVFQIIKEIIDAEENISAFYMYISYHNDKNKFEIGDDGEPVKIYQTNSGKNIIYKYRIR